MKLLGITNGKKILTSVAHYDFRSWGEGEDYIMMDGGVNTKHSYNRFSVTGRKVWFEIPETYAELYNDWNNSIDSPRKYGIWNLEDVRLLLPEEIPDTDSFEWRAENAIWGTNGPDGKSPTTYVMLKDCGLSHLEKIAELLERRGNSELLEIADFWIKAKVMS